MSPKAQFHLSPDSDLLVPGDVGAWPEVSDIGHPLINQLVNRTPPITSAVQISSLALRVTQCLQPSRMISIRLAVLSRRPPSWPRVGCGIVSCRCTSLAR